MNNDITLLVGTCDKYSFLWKEFVYLFDKYWDASILIDKYFMTESKTDDTLSGFKFIKNDKVPYSNCLISTLDKISTPYVLWMQDDYFLRRTLPKKTFDGYLKFVKDNNVDRLGICEDSKYYTKHYFTNGIFKLDQKSEYSISMQSSIWNTEFFKSCLVPNENPWQFEINGSQRLNKISHNIYIAPQNPPWYLEALRKGVYTEWYYDIKREENI